MLAHIDLRKAAFAYLRTDEELSNHIVARLRPARGSPWFGHDFSWVFGDDKKFVVGRGPIKLRGLGMTFEESP